MPIAWQVKILTVKRRHEWWRTFFYCHGAFSHALSEAGGMAAVLLPSLEPDAAMSALSFDTAMAACPTALTMLNSASSPNLSPSLRVAKERNPTCQLRT